MAVERPGAELERRSGAFACSWWDVPVRMRSGRARRYCALGAIMRAGYELGLRIDDAHAVLEWQLNAQVQNWNDDQARSPAAGGTFRYGCARGGRGGIALWAPSCEPVMNLVCALMTRMPCLNGS